MAKIVIHNTEFTHEASTTLVPLLYLLDSNNHPIEIINIIDAGLGHKEDICTVKKVLPKINACIGKLQSTKEMCYLPYSRIKSEAFIIKHSEKKVICEEDQLKVYIFKPAKDGKYCLVNCEPKREKFIFSEEISEIICESEKEAELIKNSENLFSDSTVKVRVYQDESYPIADMYGLNKALLEFAKNKIYLKSGGNICIDKTTAATLVDVNSGNSTGVADALKVNIEAAIEIARQIRLKNIGGQIVVDFINLNNDNDRSAVVKVLAKAVKNDRAKVRLFGFTAMGLFEMTRSTGITGII